MYGYFIDEFFICIIYAGLLPKRLFIVFVFVCVSMWVFFQVVQQCIHFLFYLWSSYGANILRNEAPTWREHFSFSCFRYVKLCPKKIGDSKLIIGVNVYSIYSMCVYVLTLCCLCSRPVHSVPCLIPHEGWDWSKPLDSKD